MAEQPTPTESRFNAVLRVVREAEGEPISFFAVQDRVGGSRQELDNIFTGLLNSKFVRRSSRGYALAGVPSLAATEFDREVEAKLPKVEPPSLAADKPTSPPKPVRRVDNTPRLHLAPESQVDCEFLTKDMTEPLVGIIVKEINGTTSEITLTARQMAQVCAWFGALEQPHG